MVSKAKLADLLVKGLAKKFKGAVVMKKVQPITARELKDRIAPAIKDAVKGAVKRNSIDSQGRIIMNDLGDYYTADSNIKTVDEYPYDSPFDLLAERVTESAGVGLLNRKTSNVTTRGYVETLIPDLKDKPNREIVNLVKDNEGNIKYLTHKEADKLYRLFSMKLPKLTIKD